MSDELPPPMMFLGALVITAIAAALVWWFFQLEGSPILATLVGLFALGACAHAVFMLTITSYILVQWLKDR